MDYTNIFRFINLITGGIMVFGGVSQFFPISFQGVVVGVYVILFGLATALLEFRIPDQVAKYCSFYFSFIGRGVFYSFIGCITLGDTVLRIVAGSLLIFLGVVYFALEFVPSIEPPANMRDAMASGEGYTEQV
jgi:hypothetical protein